LQSPEDYVQNILAFIQALPPKISPSKNMGIHPPILRIPNVLDKDFCNHLIKLYRADGGGPSGFMRQLDGKTIGVLDSTFKRRRDLLIEDQSLKEKINNLVKRRIQPEIKKSYQFDISRFERYLIACYDESDKGFFRAHRDNTSSGTIHRKFAMTLNLNTGEYEGGYLWFPEYGPLYYRPEIGEAIIFSCSLLHEATPVIKGQRFTLLSFFYGEEDVTIREKNKHLIVHA
jgi:predicted 2-oxoglutarate/Fe(II)-dependent dioxygenase YbiX